MLPRCIDGAERNKLPKAFTQVSPCLTGTVEFLSSKTVDAELKTTWKTNFAPMVFLPMAWYDVISILYTVIKNSFSTRKGPRRNLGYFIKPTNRLLSREKGAKKRKSDKSLDGITVVFCALSNAVTLQADGDRFAH